MIDKLDENIIFLLFILFTVIIVILSWLSTNVREFAFPANLLVIERRSRRLYATTVHGNINRSKVLTLKLLKFFSLNKIMLKFSCECTSIITVTYYNHFDAERIECRNISIKS